MSDQIDHGNTLQWSIPTSALLHTPKCLYKVEAEFHSRAGLYRKLVQLS